MNYYHDQLQEKYLAEARSDIISDVDYCLEIAIKELDAKACRELVKLKARALAEEFADGDCTGTVAANYEAEADKIILHLTHPTN
jgi:hypothetical protein